MTDIHKNVLYIHSTTMTVLGLMWLFYPKTMIEHVYEDDLPIELYGYAVYMCLAVGASALSLAACLCMIAQRANSLLMHLCAFGCCVKGFVCAWFWYGGASHVKGALLIAMFFAHMTWALFYFMNADSAKPVRSEATVNSSFVRVLGAVTCAFSMLFVVAPNWAIVDQLRFSRGSPHFLSPLAVFQGSNCVTVGLVMLGFSSRVSQPIVNTFAVTHLVRALTVVYTLFVGITPPASSTVLEFSETWFLKISMLGDLCIALWLLTVVYRSVPSIVIKHKND